MSAAEARKASDKAPEQKISKAATAMGVCAYELASLGRWDHARASLALSRSPGERQQAIAKMLECGIRSLSAGVIAKSCDDFGALMPGSILEDLHHARELGGDRLARAHKKWAECMEVIQARGVKSDAQIGAESGAHPMNLAECALCSGDKLLWDWAQGRGIKLVARSFAEAQKEESLAWGICDRPESYSIPKALELYLLAGGALPNGFSSEFKGKRSKKGLLELLFTADEYQDFSEYRFADWDQGCERLGQITRAEQPGRVDRKLCAKDKTMLARFSVCAFNPEEFASRAARRTCERALEAVASAGWDLSFLGTLAAARKQMPGLGRFLARMDAQALAGKLSAPEDAPKRARVRI